MRFTSPWLRKFTGLGVTAALRGWMSTLDIAGCLYDPASDPVHPEFQGPAIFVLWHEYIPVPFYVRPRGRMSLLVSRHADAEWLSQAARYAGLGTVRGSTGRGGATAMLELLGNERPMNLAITPDGPRGPRRKMSMGVVFLASQTQWPVILFASGYDRPWRLPTWDRFAVPRPYSRCRALIGPPTRIPAGLDRDGLEAQRQLLERQLLTLTDAAERWAESGRRWPGQIPGEVRKAVPLSLRPRPGEDDDSDSEPSESRASRSTDLQVREPSTFHAP